jgi:hypothetical protein
MTSPLNGAIVRVVPVNGLLVDAELWAAAHDFHRLHQQRHALIMHGPGIAGGLEVVAHEPPNRTLIIYPGLAIDPTGNVILLPECERYTVQTEQPGPVYVLLQFREVASGARGPAGAGAPTHLREAYRITEHRSLPEEPHVELARIWLTGGREPIMDAADPFSPAPNQINLSHRLESGGLAVGEITIGQAWLDAMPAPIHPALPLRLVQLLGGSSHYRARFIGQVPPAEAVNKCDLLYVSSGTNISLSGGDVEGLRAFLDSGGAILGDSCYAEAGDGGQDPFAATFGDLANKLGRSLKPVDRSMALLREPYTFGAPPPGSAKATMLAADGLIYCGADYGCAVTGGHAKKPLERETIRAAGEMLVNVAVYAFVRRRAARFGNDRRAP